MFVRIIDRSPNKQKKSNKSLLIYCNNYIYLKLNMNNNILIKIKTTLRFPVFNEYMFHATYQKQRTGWELFVCIAKQTNTSKVEILCIR